MAVRALPTAACHLREVWLLVQIHFAADILCSSPANGILNIVIQEQANPYPLSAEVTASVHSALEKGREKLLDLTLRNRALNFRLRKAQGVVAIDADLSGAFKLLVKDGKRLTFHATRREDDKDSAELASDEDADEFVVPTVAYLEDEEALEPTVLKTPYKPSILDKRLLGSYRATRLFLQEQGFSPLYLAFGMLNWFESPDSDIGRQAPLLLVPVSLSRTNVRFKFSIKLDDGEIQANQSLQEKLRQELPIADFPIPQESEEPEAYFDRIEELVRGQPRWSIDRSALVLDTFSFSKLVMYHDLDKSTWSQGRAPSDHLVIRGMLGSDGFGDSTVQYDDNVFMDTIVAPEDLPLVVEADSSQLQALLEAENAQQLVIQGPPGTGKSQTITNLIALALARNKKALFVSEKMAALEVVKRNLEQVGLGATCLELHSYKTNKKAFLKELGDTLALRSESVGRAQVDARLQLVKDRRKHLNAYAEAVNTPVRSSSFTPHQLYGKLLQLKGRTTIALAELTRFGIEGMLDWDQPTWQRKHAYVSQLQSWCHRHGVPGKHPLWGAKKRVVLLNTVAQIRSACEAALKATRDVVALATELATRIGVAVPTSQHEARLVANAAKALAGVTDFKHFGVFDSVWLEHTDDLKKIVKAKMFGDRIMERYEHILLSAAWQADVEGTRRDLAQYGRRFGRFLSGRYRRASRAVADLCQDRPPKSLDERLALLEAIMRMQRAQKFLREHANVATLAWGDNWQRQWRDLEALEVATSWMIDAHQKLAQGELPPDFLETLMRNRTYRLAQEEPDQLLAALKAQANALRTAVASLELDEATRFPNASLATESFDVQLAALEEWHAHADKLSAMVQFNHLAEALIEAGLANVLKTAISWDAASEYLVTAFEHDWYDKLLGDAFNERPALASFDGSTHEELVDDFRRLDQLGYEQKRLELQGKHHTALPTSPSGSAFVTLQGQIKLRRPRMPIRKLMEESGRVIQRIKPVFMMSPLSVAMFLPPGRVEFDIVIFDEASQLRPEEALGAICRSKQVIVVGDSKQLPPTTFFDNAAQQDGDGDDAAGTMLLDSILDNFEVKGAPQKTLRWHYRSQHESLIAVSNEEFYTPPGLFVFPSARKDGLGLMFHHHPETVYQRGGGKNPDEARIVARAVMEHFRRYSNESLGVAAFNVQQMTAIEDELERLRREDPTLERFFSENQRAPFFVKNLETIQGDERDVIFISVGYGRDRDGNIGMNFGPVNQAGGERRLNVLMTRARKRCEIFSNLASRDIRLTGSQGVEVLKRFLHYAETGKLVSLPHQRGGFGSPFEKAVYQELTKLGHEVHSQVGVAGYFIDLAIVNPDQPGSYLLGIECDGASYHSARSARDRDRLRQFVLEQHRGWRIHRIWSTDWFMNPQRQLERVVEAIERAKVAVVSVNPVSITGPLTESPEEVSTLATEVIPLPAPPFAVSEGSLAGGIDAEGDTDTEATATAGSTETSLGVAHESKGHQPAERVREDNMHSDGNEALNSDQRCALAIGAKNCFALARWARANGKFRNQDRNFLYNMGVKMRRLSAPTPNQATYLLDLYDQAAKEGFKNEE